MSSGFEKGRGRWQVETSEEQDLERRNDKSARHQQVGYSDQELSRVFCVRVFCRFLTVRAGRWFGSSKQADEIASDKRVL